jgi:hypothetical protein
MKGYGLLVAGFAVVVLTLLLLVHSRASAARPHHPGSHRGHRGISASRVSDALNSPAGRRWLTGQPTHWHAVLLQR